MKISLVNFSRRKIGGTEQNLDVVIPELERRGHEIQFLYVHDEPEDRAPIATGPATRLVHIGHTGFDLALRLMREFEPDLINVHGEIDPAFQASLIDLAPAAYSVHNYYGTCISGLKVHQFPIVQPCTKTFGSACLVRYFPLRCGGLNPITMVRRYNTERDRLAVMARYDAVITHSGHMEAEYRRHGLHPARIFGLPYEVTQKRTDEPAITRPPLSECARLLFVGRMEKLKGGQRLIAALPRVHAKLGRPIELNFAGDGPQRAHWTELSRRLMERHPGIRIHFHGWLSGAALDRLYAASHLLAVPSLWPEPFGKVGPEAAGYGIPVAAFAVGGIGEWLIPGVNGVAAPGNPPTAGGLAAAIVECLRDPALYAHLCEGALASVSRFRLDTHVDRLVELFTEIARVKRPAHRPTPEPAFHIPIRTNS